MKKFMDKNFLLNSDVAIKLYHDFAKNMPIIDYHCHINPKEIADDISFENITQVWLYGDHYKWRAMRACGIDEKYITGDGSDYDKFLAWASIMPKLIGNPLFHWSHLELQRYFDYHGILNEKTAPEVWDICNEKIKNLSSKKLIEMSNVEVVCTTDDPIDSLEYHKAIADSEFNTKVYPAWRPDMLMGIEKYSFVDYISKLSKASGIEIDSLDSLKNAIENRIEFFNKMGCVISDHGLPYVMYELADDSLVDDILKKALSGGTVNELEALQFKTTCLLFMARLYHKYNWTMQLHYGVVRNNNVNKFNRLGPDTGLDCIGDSAPITSLISFLNHLEENNCLPKTIIYSLNPIDNTSIDTAIGCFQGDHILGQLQHGAAWWFNDNKTGMEEHLTSLSNQGVLGNFVGMLTDSRSFLSYTRHEYFRRILCNFIGELVEKGEYPEDYDMLEKVVKDICYYNAKEYFGM